jgi:hypothetical protein
MPRTAVVASSASIQAKIVVVRGEKTLLDADLASVYAVTTKHLNQAVKRNLLRFPSDFVFQLSLKEWASLKSQTVTSNDGRGGRRKRPWVFTEHGAIMAAMVLQSPRAIDMSVFVVRAFVRTRELAGVHVVLAKLTELEKRLTVHDSQLRDVIATLRALLTPPLKPRRRIGYSS